MDELVIHVPPLVAIAGYLAYPKQLRIDPSLLYMLSIIHNAALTIFSAYTFFSLAQIIYTDGIVFQHEYYFSNPQFDTIIYYFYLSKYYEFFDTFLLYLNGKTPIFLQKYHHIGAVICWHIAYVYKADGIWIPSIANSLVHTVMYSYYLGCLLKIKQVRFIKKYITTMQLIQLLGSMLSTMVIYMPIETERCAIVMIIFTVYVSILVILFAQFFYTNYIKQKTT